MLQKASQARALYSQSREPVFPVTRADDEFSFVAGRTKLVNDLDNIDLLNPHPSHPSHSRSRRGTAASTSNYGSSSALQPTEIASRYIDSTPATLLDLGGGWDSLFYELPQSSYQRLAGEAGDSERTGVDDSTAPFMNYGVLMQPPSSNSYQALDRFGI